MATAPLHLLVIYVVMQWSLMSITSSQTTICVWNSIDSWDHINGEYTLQSGAYNGYSFWKQVSTSGSCPQTPYFIFAEYDIYYLFWVIDDGSPSSLIGVPVCDDMVYNKPFPADPTQCQVGYYFWPTLDQYHSYRLPLTITSGSCPSLRCNSIKITNTGYSRCDTTFYADHTKNNVFASNDNTYFFFNQYVFKWICSETYSDWTDCDGAVNAIIGAENDEWQDVSVGSSITIFLSNMHILTLECSSDTRRPTAAPAAPSAYPSTQPTSVSPTTYPSSLPTQNPSNTPTSVPSQMPSVATGFPSVAPTIHPSSLPTQNPSNPSNAPTTVPSQTTSTSAPSQRPSSSRDIIAIVVSSQHSTASAVDVYETTASLPSQDDNTQQELIPSGADRYLFFYFWSPVVIICILVLCVCFVLQCKQKKQEATNSVEEANQVISLCMIASVVLKPTNIAGISDDEDLNETHKPKDVDGEVERTRGRDSFEVIGDDETPMDNANKRVAMGTDARKGEVAHDKDVKVACDLYAVESYSDNVLDESDQHVKSFSGETIGS
eukprot:542687_1